MNIAIILAGGTGTRVGADVPKQFIKIMDKPILAYTLEVFQNNSNIDVIEVVCHPDWVEEVQRINAAYGITKVKWLVTGGGTFQESVMNGVFNLRDKISEDDIVVISFGVSPLTTDEIIDDSIRVCKLHGNAIASEDMVLCTCIKDDEYSTIQGILRETIKGFSNPWTFRFGELCEAYQAATDKGILDKLEPHTTSLYLELGKRLYFSKTVSTNIKITTKEDLDLFEGHLLLMQRRNQMNVITEE